MTKPRNINLTIQQIKEQLGALAYRKVGLRRKFGVAQTYALTKAHTAHVAMSPRGR
jgi:hypothetical protein